MDEWFGGIDRWLQSFGVDPEREIAAWSRWFVAKPVAFLVLTAIPFLLLAWARRSHPTPVLLRWALVVSAASIGVISEELVVTVSLIATTAAVALLVHDWFPRIVSTATRWLARAAVFAAIMLLMILARTSTILVGIDAVLLLLAVFDLLRMPLLKRLSAARGILKIASLNKRHDVELTLTNGSRRTLRMELVDDLAQTWIAQPASFDVRLKPRSRTTFGYHFRARRRGKFRMECLHLRVRSPWGLWWRYVRLPVESEVHVYPDMAQLRDYAILARTNRLSLLGVRRTRKVGQDNEFERLRDYSLDDNFRHIDWRATARGNRLTVRDFQVNQSQRLIFMIDCGRMMTNESAGIAMLDHAINAMLMASFVALRQGDAVGLICFNSS